MHRILPINCKIGLKPGKSDAISGLDGFTGQIMISISYKKRRENDIFWKKN